jgi:hypothetical protein
MPDLWRDRASNNNDDDDGDNEPQCMRAPLQWLWRHVCDEARRWTQLLTPTLRRGSIQLFVLWLFAAFTYYGVVLLTPAVLGANVCDEAPNKGIVVVDWLLLS